MITAAGSLAALLALGAASLPAQSISGEQVLQRMHDAYAKKWYHTLTFTQKTTMRGRDGTSREQTWYESLQYLPQHGAILRIDFGDPALGNGVLYRADSSWRVTAGKPGRAADDGNPFIPLIENVYLQPVVVTVQQLASLHIDLSRVADVSYDGHPAWAVGASSPTDSASAQFWIEKDRLVVVRMLLILAPGRPPYDIHLDKYEKAGKGWLATKVTMFNGGVAQQTEEYSGWNTDMKLDGDLFNPTTWTTGKHWMKK